MSTGKPDFSPVNVSAYGLAPMPESPRNPFVPQPWPQEPQTFGTFGPCPKCKRHCRAGECPFCYADSLKPKALSAEVERLKAENENLEKLRAQAVAERDEARRERDTLQRKLDGLLRDLDKATAGYR